MLDKITVSGCTIVRNASILNYPFRESVLSVLPLCDEFVINCGDSDDDTVEICKSLQKEFPGKVKIFYTVWNQEGQKGGLQLSSQTDAAVARCAGDWCFYIQADEVIHENDLHKIHAAIKKAQNLKRVDGILFDYIHFYGNFTHAIRGRNWYRREVRCFKTGRGVKSFRDAQGFRKDGNRINAIYSGARMYHYGYVRSSQSLKTKSKEMDKWWGTKTSENENDFQLIRHVGLKRFTGTHPKLMQERIAQNSTYFDPEKCPRKWDKREIKNAVTLLWESVFPFRIGEYRNYEIIRT